MKTRTIIKGFLVAIMSISFFASMAEADTITMQFVWTAGCLATTIICGKIYNKIEKEDNV